LESTDCHFLKDTIVYKILYSAVDEEPEVTFN
jgi:hypothetical protein